MTNAILNVPPMKNEEVLSYSPSSGERIALLDTIKSMKEAQWDIPMIINGQKIRTRKKIKISAPHALEESLGTYSKGSGNHVRSAIKAAVAAKPAWQALDWESRAAIFLKAADLVAGRYRQQLNAATMLGQSKNIHQSEIDAVAEMADFFRFNAHFMRQIYEQQPMSPAGVWNRMEYRALEGFVFALTPFNFTSIAANLATAPAMLGNTVVWKPAETQIYSAHVIMKILVEAGLPAGVINLIFVDGPTAGKIIFRHPDFAGLHFTGSTAVFQELWKTIGNNLARYRNYPRIVGETGGKDFVVAHPTADVGILSTALTRGAFEYQGQKCSAASRAYIPKSLWREVSKNLKVDLSTFKIGTPEDFGNFINAVIDERAFKKITGYINRVKRDKSVQIVAGGNYSMENGYFIQPTVLRVQDPRHFIMHEEIFGPVLSVYVYDDDKFTDTLKLVDETSPYGLTGAIFAKDRSAICEATDALKYAAGNFYINDKPTGAVVGQQPFGGARASGTNDKAGSVLNLYRWISPRTIKENLDAPRDYRYPFLDF
ncbi:MAG: L-glutamate gamma-semialdehyde dehydrogenase [Saprospiraceae bacterium]|nr:L-glutamate gamma-semialdehyde dehydrogenase [Saprospiraceae bacterium]